MIKEPIYGGIVNLAYDCEIKNCKNYGKITAEGGYIGGIACDIIRSKIEKCVNYAELSGGLEYVWPVAGILSISNVGKTVISECANLGNITGGRAAGIVGNTYNNDSESTYLLTIENSYNSGQISGETRSVGICICEQHKCEIKNSYNVGTVSAKNQDCNATYKIGGDMSGYEMYTDKLYYLDTCCTRGEGESKTEQQMKDPEFLKNFDLNIWTSDIKDEKGNWMYNNGYPILRWQK